MEATPATPDAELTEDPTGTPEGEPAETTEDEAPADQPAVEPNTALGQAEYTRSQQAFSALKAELGLDRRASRDEVIAAVNALKAGEQTDDDEVDDEPLDPRIAAAEERAFRAELAAVEAIYGGSFATDAIELTNFLRTNDDPREIMVAIAAFRDAHGAAATEAAIDDELTEDPNAVPAPVGLSEGDGGPSARQAITASAARRESGAQQEIRGLFAKLGISSRPPPPS